MTALYWARYVFLGVFLLVVAYLVFLNFSQKR